MTNRSNSPWSERAVVDLTLMWADGLTCKQIGLKLGFTRNAIVGKVQRLKLPVPEGKKAVIRKGRAVGPYKKKSTANTGQHHLITRIVKANGNSNEMKVTQSITSAQYKLRCVEVKCTVPFADVTGCRYTDGDGPFLFCDGPQQAGSSYCTPHFHLTRQEPKPFLDKVMRRFAA